MTPCPFEAVVFDLDGTLIDRAPAVLSALNKTLSAMGLRAITRAELPAMLGHGARATLERGLAATGSDTAPDAVDRAMEVYLEFYLADPAADTIVYPGARDVLDALRRQDIRLGICTNKPSATTRPTLDALGLTPYFASVRCGDAEPHPKPDGRHLVAVLDDLGASVSRSVYVGDAKPDVDGARNAGMPVVIVDFGGQPGGVAGLRADAVITHFNALSEAFAGLTASQATVGDAP